MWPFKKRETKPTAPAAANSPASEKEFLDSVSKLYALAFDDAMPLEVRKVALLEMTQHQARHQGTGAPGDQRFEHAYRLKLFIVLSLLGDRALAEQQLQLAVTASYAAPSPDKQKKVGSMNDLAQKLAAQNRFHEAEVVLQAAMKYGTATFGPEFPDQVNLLTNHAIILFSTRRYREAEAVRRQELLLRKQDAARVNLDANMQAINQTRILLCQEGLADAIAAQGRSKEALDIYGTLLHALQNSCYTPDRPGFQRIREKHERCKVSWQN